MAKKTKSTTATAPKVNPVKRKDTTKTSSVPRKSFSPTSPSKPTSTSESDRQKNENKMKSVEAKKSGTRGGAKSGSKNKDCPTAAPIPPTADEKNTQAPAGHSMSPIPSTGPPTTAMSPTVSAANGPAVTKKPSASPEEAPTTAKKKPSKRARPPSTTKGKTTTTTCSVMQKKATVRRTTREKDNETGELKQASRMVQLKPRKAALLKEGDLIEGVTTFKVLSMARLGNINIDYKVRDESNPEKELNMRTEPLGRTKLKYMANICNKVLKQNNADKHILEYIEFGINMKHRLNYLVTCAYTMQIDDIRHYVLKSNYTPDCAMNIAIQSLKALQSLHEAGYICRNIKPASFSAGFAATETTVYLVDLRIARAHIDTFTRLPKAARDKVPWIGTQRFASRAAMQAKDQGRKDDLESWVYTVFNLIDDEKALAWKKSTKEKTLELKEQFFKNESPDQYVMVPTQMKRIVEYVGQLSYDTEPDYKYLFTSLANMAQELNLQVTTCDWAGKISTETIATAKNDTAEKSADNKLDGQDDFDGPPGIAMGTSEDLEKRRKAMMERKAAKQKKVAERLKMSAGDICKSATVEWKVVNLLGSGGFGDVYKVYNHQAKGKPPHYALKTEQESGKKSMLRLKVESMVLQTIQDERKKKSTHLNHFVEFLDKGKSDSLKCKFVVMSLVGPSLEDIRRKYKVDLAHKHTPFMASVQTIEAVRDLHTLGYIHRDIKPANFAVGLGDHESTVFMLDFGIARSFLDPQTREHRAPRKTVKFMGTIRYASRACMKCTDQGRKDDLECWIYMTYDMMDEDDAIFWKRMSDRNAVLMAKECFFAHKVDSVYNSVSKKMKKLTDYVNSLNYNSEPDYQYIISYLKTSSSELGFKNSAKLEWVGKLKHVPKETTVRFDSDSDGHSGSGSD